MKKVTVWSPEGVAHFVEVETKSEFNNLFRDGWVGNGTPWEELPNVED